MYRLIILGIFLFLSSCQEREVVAPAIAQETSFSSMEINLATLSLVKLHHLIYNFNKVDQFDFQNLINEETQEINFEYVNSIADNTEYKSGEALIDDVVFYSVIKSKLSAVLEEEKHTSKSEELFRIAMGNYLKMQPNFKTEEECIQDRSDCFADALAFSMNQALNCSSNSNLMSCLSSSDPVNCGGNGYIVLQFTNCEAQVFSDFTQTYQNCESSFEDCMEECCSVDPVLPNGGVVPWEPNPVPVGGGGGSSNACFFDVDCTGCLSYIQYISCMTTCVSC